MGFTDYFVAQPKPSSSSPVSFEGKRRSSRKKKKKKGRKAVVPLFTPATDRPKGEGNRPPSRNMYHPTRGGVRGGRDQFKWDDVKVDKHRENYLGHSVKAPVGRWQKGKDLLWYAKDKKSNSEDALKEEIRRVKEEEEQAMREALGLAPKRSNRPQGNRLDKHEYADLIKRGSTAEDLGAGHAEAAQVQGLGLYKAPRDEGEASSLKLDPPEMMPEQVDAPPAAKQEDSEDDRKVKRRREERRGEKERKREKHADGKERRRDKHDRRHDSEDRSKRHRKDKQKRRHDSD